MLGTSELKKWYAVDRYPFVYHKCSSASEAERYATELRSDNISAVSVNYADLQTFLVFADAKQMQAYSERHRFGITITPYSPSKEGITSLVFVPNLLRSATFHDPALEQMRQGMLSLDAGRSSR